MTERKTLHGPGPDTKGGGFRGGPRRWTGAGPAPARHIPWPEIFKHHISVCEGHIKMVDMVRKHTVEGTGNYRTIMGCVERTKHMLHEVKQISRFFVPPPKQREQVPLGSSSASMYPGYSPADHEYGKAAEEYGKAAAEARARGEKVHFDDLEYEIGQAKGIKRRTLAGIREAKVAREGTGKGTGSGTGSGSDSAIGPTPPNPAATNGTAATAKVEQTGPEGENPYFVIDTKPTPVNLSGASDQTTKRSASPPPQPHEGKKHKKQKKKHEGELPKGEEADKVEFEDISGEVDARMKEKEEKRKRKEEKKRKRESAGEPASTVPVPESADAVLEAEKPKKKKSKHPSDGELADRTVSSKKRSVDVHEEPDDREGKKKKWKKAVKPSDEI